jgi:hypothetical protein
MLKIIKLTIFTLILALSTHTYAASNASWDIDKNGRVDALTDALLLLRHLFDVSGPSLTDGAISPDSPLDHNGILSSLDDTMAIADIDGSGHVDALTDALILLRYLFDVSGDLLIDSAIYPSATRSTHSIVTSYIKSKMPDQVSSGGETISDFAGYWSTRINSQNELLFTPDGYVAAFFEGTGDDYDFNLCFGSYSQGGNQINVNLDCSSYFGNTSIGVLTAQISANGNSLEILTHDGLMASDDYIFTNDTTLSNDYYSASNTNVIPGIYELEDITPTVFIEVKSTGEINTTTNSMIGGTLDTQDCIIDGDIKPNPIHGFSNQDNPVSVLDGSVNVSNCNSNYSGELNADNQTAIYSAYKQTEYYDADGESYYYLDIFTQDFTLYAELVCDADFNPTYFIFDEYSASFCDGFKDDYSPPQDDYFGNATIDTLVGYWGYYDEGDDNLVFTRGNNVQLENDIYDCYGGFSTDVSNTTITLFLSCFDEDSEVQVAKTLTAKISSQGRIHFIDSGGLNLSPYLPKLISESYEGSVTIEISPVTPGIYYLWDYDNFVEISVDGQISSVNNNLLGYSSSCDVSGQITVSTPDDTAVDGNLSIANCEEYDGTLVSVDKNIIATGFTEYLSEGTYHDVSIYSAYDELDLTLVCDASNVETYFASYYFPGYENFCSGFEPIAFENASPNKLVGHWVANNTEGSEDYLMLSVDGKAALGSDEDYGCFGSYSISGSDVTVSLDCFDYEGEFDVSISAKLVEGGNRLYVINATGISGINNSFTNKADGFSDGYETFTFTSLKPGIYSLDMDHYVFVEVTSSGEVSTIDHPDYQTNCIVSANFEISSVFDVADGVLSISNCSIEDESFSESNMAVSLSTYETEDGGRISVDVFTPYGVLWADRVCDENLTPDNYYGGFESDLCEKFDEDYVEPINTNPNPTVNDLVGFWGEYDAYSNGNYIKLSRNQSIAVETENYRCLGSYTILNDAITAPLSCITPVGYVYSSSITFGLNAEGGTLLISDSDFIDLESNLSKLSVKTYDWYDAEPTNITPGIYYIDDMGRLFVEVSASGQINTIEHPSYPPYADYPCSFSGNISNSSLYDSVADGSVTISGCRNVSNWADGWGNVNANSSNTQAVFATINQNFENPDPESYTRLDINISNYKFSAELVCDDQLMPTGLGTGAAWAPDLCDGFIQNPDNGPQPDNSFHALLESGIWVYNPYGVIAEFAFSDGLVTLNVVDQQQDRTVYIDCIGSYIQEYTDSLDGGLDCSIYYYSTIDSTIGLAQSFTTSIYGEIYDENEPSLVFEIPEIFDNGRVYYRSINPTTVPSSGIYAVYGMEGIYVQISGGSIETYNSWNMCDISGSIDMNMQEGISNETLYIDECYFDDNMEFKYLNPNGYHDVIYKGVDLTDGYKIHFTAPGYSDGNAFWSSFTMVCDAYGNPTDYALSYDHDYICSY